MESLCCHLVKCFIINPMSFQAMLLHVGFPRVGQLTVETFKWFYTRVGQIMTLEIEATPEATRAERTHQPTLSIS